MNDAFLYALLIYSGIALAVALAAVVVQAVFLSLATRMGSFLLASVPAIALGAGALVVVLSRRDLQLTALYGGISAEGAGALWITRFANLVLLAIALAKLAQLLFAHKAKFERQANGREHEAARRVFVAFLVYAFCSLILPMVFGTRPSFSHDGLVAVPMFAAVYLARGEPMDRFLTSARITLLLIVLASLVVAAVAPQMTASKYPNGLIPGFPYRFWGLASHPNTMGGLSIALMLMLLLHPSRRRWLQVIGWCAALTVLILTQSKTSWLAILIAMGTIVVYRRGMDASGRLHMGVWISLLLGLALLASAFLLIDGPTVISRFVESDAGSGLTTLTGRTKIWEAAIQMWLDSPWFGYGPEAWSPLHRMELGVPYATQAHNQMLEALSEGGLAYAVPMAVYFLLLGGAAFRSASWTRGVSVAFFLVIAFRCISEAPFGIGNMTSGDVVLHLILFMIVVSERARPAEVRRVGVAVPRNMRLA